ncbi:hypothetical protein EVAR_103254_1 [Eumeta japonica]|uniref:Uncharacterized protein n=1 Tax=Eumeta variegata TaxID=151549 RepID=A0A4C1YBD3_EUMVA|nr:hypothetical protein EVAR_103254_1 [Eumeta japonica]
MVKCRIPFESISSSVFWPGCMRITPTLKFTDPPAPQYQDVLLKFGTLSATIQKIFEWGAAAWPPRALAAAISCVHPGNKQKHIVAKY